MFKITPEKLSLFLKKYDYFCYILFGTEVFYLEESKKKILKKSKKRGFYVIKTFYFKKEKKFLKFLNTKNQNDLFFSKKIVIVYIEYYLKEIFFSRLLPIIFNNLNKNVILIIYYLQPKFFNLNNFRSFPFLFVICTTPSNNQLLIWLKKKILEINLNIEPVLITILCQYYEKNILGLSNTLKILSLIFKKKKITYKNSLKIISYIPNFALYDWLNSVFNQNLDRAIKILDNLILKNNQILLLIKLLQKDIFKLIYFKKTSLFYKDKEDKQSIFETLKVNLLKKISKFFSLMELHKILQYLINLEIIYKNSYENIIFDKLKKLTILICCKKNRNKKL